MKNVTRTTLSIVLLMLASAGMAETTAEPRQSMTSQGTDIARGSVGTVNATFDEYAPLRTEGTRSKKNTRSAQFKSGGVAAQSGDPNFWFYDVDLQLFADHDRDGYFTGIDLLFDVDTTYAVADVYAVLYLSYELGPWEEYAATDDFTLFGSTSADDYIVETELVSGYPTGNYDLLIELFDAYDGTYLTSIGPEETSELSIIPLEDASRDVFYGDDTVVVVNSGGGSFGLVLLFGLLALRMTFRPHAARSSK